MRKYVLSALLCPLFAWSCIASDVDQSAESVIESIDIIGSAISQEQSSGGYRLDRAQISLINPLSTVDLLRHIPGLLISQNSQGSGQSFVSLRGGESNYTLVMIDDVIVNDPTNSRGGGFDFNQLNWQTIERIEVFRGAVSAIYGSEAISGVIHFVTRQQAKTSVELGAGDNGYRQGSLTVGAPLSDNSHALLNLSSQQARHSQFSRAKNDQLLLKLTHQQSTWNNQFSLLVGQRDTKSLAEDSGGESFANPMVAEQRENSMMSANIRTQWRPTQGKYISQITADLSYSNQQQSSNHPGIRDGVYSGIPASEIDSDYRRIEARLYANWPLNEHWNLITGVSQRRSVGENSGFLDYGFALPVDFKLEQDLLSVYGQLSGQLADARLNMSIRHENPDGFDSDTSSRVGINWPISDKLSLLASYSEGYKLPSFFALAHPLIGNSELLPESSIQSDVALHYALSQHSDLQFSIFKNTFSNLVDFDPEIFKSVNRHKVDVKGAEGQLTTKFNHWLSINVHLNYQDVDASPELGQLRRRPRWFGGAALNLDWQPYQLSLSNESRSDFLDSSIATGAQRLGGYTSWRLSGRWQINQQWRLGASVDNLLGKSRIESIGFRDSGRQFHLNLSHQW